MGRGPSYPYVGLEEAVGLARKMYDYAKRGAAPTESVVKDAWNYSPTSSSGAKVLAALRAYGLLEEAPGTNGKSLKLTARAVRILLDEQDSAERKSEIKKAALSPKWYEYCWKHWGKDMPPSMRSNLLIEHGFVDTTVDGFLRDYRKTMAFAGLLNEPDFGKTEESESQSSDRVKIGDYVQWESQGVFQFPVAKKLTKFSPDGEFGFVDGYATGMPVAELVLAEAPDTALATLSAVRPIVSDAPAARDSELRLETFSLSEGISVQIRWPASITNDAFQDLEDWLKLVVRRIGRAVTKDDFSKVTEKVEGPDSGDAH